MIDSVRLRNLIYPAGIVLKGYVDHSYDGLSNLSNLAGLRWLDLDETKITDAGLWRIPPLN